MKYVSLFGKGLVQRTRSFFISKFYQPKIPTLAPTKV
nr:MAG TPA: hypothetical protein [Caudoviricetes sp.]DAR14244.1 MAG TPA: hypothetical protein [Caudoviricetes sp.]